MSTARIRCYARVRPALAREVAGGDGGLLHRCVGAHPQFPRRIFVSSDASRPVLVHADGSVEGEGGDVRCYDLDAVFDEARDTEGVYASACSRTVAGALDGVNGSILCYGMTSSGKTHTMLGDERHCGIVGMAAQQLLDDPDSTVEVSFMQLYGNTPTDLLHEVRRGGDERAGGRGTGGRTVGGRSSGGGSGRSSGNSSGSSSGSSGRSSGRPSGGAVPSSVPKLVLRSMDRGKGTRETIVEGLSRHAVGSAAEVERLVRAGAARRATGKQNLNDVSSRSHAVLTFYVTRTTSSAMRTEYNASAKANANVNDDAEDDDDVYGEGKEGKHGGGGRDGDFPSKEDDLGGDEGDAVVTTAKLHCVDLAGSERVKESGVVGQALVEARQINLSLFHLIRVVHALNAGDQRVPYKESALTHLLQDALGGNCHTVFIATVSPAQRHASQTASTLSFATACMRVVNETWVNRVVARRRIVEPPTAPRQPSRKTELARGRAAAKRLPWAGASPGDASCPLTRCMVAGVSCLLFGDEAARDAVVCLHGYPSDAETTAWIAPALVHAGLFVVAIDMPGCGDSPGPSLKTRSEYNLIPGGAADVVRRVLKALRRRSATLFGYDWGGGIALSMASSTKHRVAVDKLVVCHASYAERERGDLDRVKCDTFVLWSKDDNFHPWSKFRPLAKRLRTNLRDRYTELLVKRSEDAAWMEHARGRAIVKFITGVDYLPSSERVEVHVEKDAVGVGGTRIVARQGVVFRDDIVADGGEAALRPRDAVGGAARAVAELHGRGTLGAAMRAYVGAGGVAKREAVKLFGQLPVLDPGTLSARRLCDLGLWSEAAASASRRLQGLCAGAPRFFPGRRLIVPGDMIGTLVSLQWQGQGQGQGRGRGQVQGRGPGQGRQSGKTARETGGRYEGKYDGDDGDDGDEGGGTGPPLNVDVEVDGRGLVRFSLKELLDLNQRHVLPLVPSGQDATRGSAKIPTMRLEDGMWADFGSPLMRAKMAEVALALGPHLERLGDVMSDLGDVESRVKDVQVHATNMGDGVSVDASAASVVFAPPLPVLLRVVSEEHREGRMRASEKAAIKELLLSGDPADMNAAVRSLSSVPAISTLASAHSGGRYGDKAGGIERVASSPTGSLTARTAVVHNTTAHPHRDAMEALVALETVQCAAVKAMRRCLDITTFEREGGERGRERDRYARDDVARMAVYGEGHCRTCSSCLAPFLYAFAEVIGVDVLYRMDEHGRHQWLEFHTRPSMRAFSCDVYRDEGPGGGGRGDLIAEPLELALSKGGAMWPSARPIKLSGQYQIVTAGLEPADYGRDT